MAIVWRAQELVEREENHVYRAALAILKNREDAEDVTQETFVKLFLKQPTFESETHARAWLLRVAINLSKSRLRLVWRRRRETLLESYPAPEPESRELLEAVIALRAPERTVVHLYYYEGYSTAEIATLTGSRESTVRSRLSRARARLRAQLEGEIP